MNEVASTKTHTEIIEELNRYGLDLKQAHRCSTAKIVMERAIKMAPTTGILWNNYGAVLWELNLFEEAEIAFKTAIEHGYNKTMVHMNLGLLYGSMQRWDDAEAAFKAGEQCPEDKTIKWRWQDGAASSSEKKKIQWERSITLLDQGKWKEGLELYDIRREVKAEYRPLKYPLWKGEDLTGKRLFIQDEQGTGDRILFSRYLHWIATTWPSCKILWLTDHYVHNLFWELKQTCNIEFIPDRVPWPEADYGQYLMNLPHIHGTTIDNVYPDPGLIKKRIEEHSRLCNLPNPEEPGSLKVGICWTGNPVMPQNTQRSIPLELMLELAENPKVVLYSLMVGEHGEKDIKRLDCDGILCDLNPEMAKEGYVGTASVIDNLDLVITCCTSVAHLAGTIGTPTWVLLCYAPYWLWLRDRDDSVWYPNVKLFRQETPGEWSGLINIVKEELYLLTNNKE